MQSSRALSDGICVCARYTRKTARYKGVPACSFDAELRIVAISLPAENKAARLAKVPKCADRYRIVPLAREIAHQSIIVLPAFLHTSAGAWPSIWATHAANEAG